MQTCEKRLLASFPSERPSVLPSVCLSAWNNSAPTGEILITFDILILFRKSVWKIEFFLLKSDKNDGYFTRRSFHVYDYLADFFLEGDLFQIKVVEKIKTHILCSLTFFRISCCLWDNVGKYGEAREDAENMAPARGILDK